MGWGTIAEIGKGKEKHLDFETPSLKVPLSHKSFVLK